MPERPAPPEAAIGAAPRIVAIANQKGGVGKTTTAINLGTALAATGRRVVIIDLDPQGNASTGLGLGAEQRRRGTYQLLFGEVDLAGATVASQVTNLAIVPASVDLSGAEIELISATRREFRLRQALAGTMPFDYVLIDCPPALGLLTLNALAAAHAVIVPLQCEFYALEGLSHLVRTIERVRGALNPHLEIQGVLLTMFDRRNNLSSAVAEDVRGFLGSKVYRTVIPRNVRVSEAPSHGKPAIIYDLHCAGSQAYVHLAGEVLRQDQRPAA